MNDQLAQTGCDARRCTCFDREFIDRDRFVVERSDQCQFARGRIEREGSIRFAVEFVFDGERRRRRGVNETDARRHAG